MTDQVVDVLVPVLGRPDRVEPLLQSLDDEPRARPLFLISPGDDAERDAVIDAAILREPGWVIWTVVDWEPGPGDYAKKINHGFRKTGTPWLLLGADDLRFHPGWLDAALLVADASGCGVIGTNDLGNPSVVAGRHATHPLVARWYVEECGASADGPGVVYHQGYDHQFCDTELVGVAQSRGCFAAAPLSVVEHLHPFWHKGDDDPTYRKGQRAAASDRHLFNQRRRMWA